MNKYSAYSGGKRGRKNKTESRRLLEQGEPSEPRRHKIIVGIDYGTTYSGVSYVTTDKSDMDDISIISQWPGSPVTSWKTPTRIAYRRENPLLIKSDVWGFEVTPKLTSYSWTKLLLDKSATAAQYDDPTIFSDKANPGNPGMMRLPPFRDAPGVCEDYLSKVFEYVSARLRREMTDAIFEKTPMECWITLPAIWSDEAKDATLKAAKGAGFGNRLHDEVFTIAEPEAAAIATLKKFTGSGTDVLNPVKPNETILILDCGGGTVDITTYKITQVEPRLDFEELCVGIGGKCGSTCIDRKLHDLLSQRFGDAFQNVSWVHKGPGSRLMTSFEGIKRDFGLNNNHDEKELGPINLGIPDSVHYDEEERLVKLSYKDIQSLFDPVVKDITKLVEEQLKEAKKNGASSIDRIILVGGFGESPYLFKVLEGWCRRNGGITLMCPQNPQSAVVRGAALRGLEGIAPRMKRARRHYGFQVAFPFREGIDPEDLAYIDEFHDMKYCRGRVKWLIAKGEKIRSDTFRPASVVRSYIPGAAFIAKEMLYSCALNDPPEYISDTRVEKVGEIKSKYDEYFDFGPNTQSNYNHRLQKTITMFEYEVQVQFGHKGANLQFNTLVNGVISGDTSIEFDQH